MTSNRQWATEVADKFESGEWGWTKHYSARKVDGKMCYCLTGAVQTYFGMEWHECECGCGLYADIVDSENNSRVWDESDRALVGMSQELFDSPFQSYLIGFNDQAQTNLEDVISKLREYARGV